MPVVPATGIYVISPAGAVLDPARAKQAADNLARLGYEVRFDPAALRRSQRFAGTDAQRLAAFGRAAAAPESIVMITRGGYGVTRILPQLDFKALAAAGKRWVGLSDFTAFQLAMLARCKAATWAGPALLEDFGTASPDEIDETTFGAFDDAMSGRLELLGFRCAGARDVDVRGTLWGGNLAMVCSLVGTPWFPKVNGGILFLEEVNEHPYRIERMLTQLLAAGVLARQRAIVFGYVSGYTLSAHDAGFDFPAVLKWLRSQIDVPVITGLPFGHQSPKLCLPHGARVGLAVEGRTAWLQLPHDHEHAQAGHSEHQHEDGGVHEHEHSHRHDHDHDHDH